MGVVRLNITLPEKMVKRLRKAAKPRERSAVIAEALELYFSRKSEAEFIRDVIEDYKATHDMSEEDREWLDADLGDNYDED